MNCDREMNLNQTNSKVHWWRTGLILVFIVALGMVNFGCQCDCEEASDEYYVRYELYVDDGLHSSTMVDITVKDENNNDENFTFNADSYSWGTIIGPVQKGFNATLGVSVETEVLMYLKIHVSKNDSPFAIKANDSSDTYRTSGQLSYTIDY
jgi:hypothetical protein